MYHNFLIHSSADGHLGCFHVLNMEIVLQWTLGYMYEVDEPGAYYTEWSKSEREIQMSYINEYIYGL